MYSWRESGGKVELQKRLFDIGDYVTTQLYGDYFISQYKDPVINQPV